MGVELIGDFGEIVAAHTEAVSVLLRGEPVVVVGRRGILLVAQKSIQVGLLRAGQAENQRSADRQVWCRAALIEFSRCQRMSSSSDSRHCRRINRTCDSIFDRMLAHSRATDEEHYRHSVRDTSTVFTRHKSVYRSDIGPSTRAELVAGVYSGYSSKGCIPKSLHVKNCLQTDCLRMGRPDLFLLIDGAA